MEFRFIFPKFKKRNEFGKWKCIFIIYGIIKRSLVYLQNQRNSEYSISILKRPHHLFMLQIMVRNENYT